MVRRIVLDPSSICYAHAINLCEVYYDSCRIDGLESAGSVITGLASAGIRFRSDLDIPFWQEAGQLKSVRKRISLADCLAVVLARKLGAALVTADHHELGVLSGAEKLLFFR